MKRIVAIALVGVGVISAAWIVNDRRVPEKVQSTEPKHATKPDATIGSEAVSFTNSSLPPPEEINSQNYAADYDALMAKAKVNVSTAYVLATRLAECNRLTDTLTAAESMELEGRVVPDSSINAAQVIVERCNGLTREQIGKYVDLLDFAAQSGVVEAQVSYSTLAASSFDLQDAVSNPEKLAEYKRKSITYLRQAAMAGNVDALMQLGMAYQDGILVGKDISEAYAHFYALGLARPGGRVPSLLTQMERSMSVDQMNLARVKGNSLYAACCR